MRHDFIQQTLCGIAENTALNKLNLKMELRPKINSLISKKGFMPIWMLGIPIFVFTLGILIPLINELSPEEKQQIIDGYKSENFNGTILDKPYCHHCSEIIVKTSLDTLTIKTPDATFYHSVEIGDSVIKNIGDNLILIKKKDDEKWKEYKYKYEPK